MAVELQQLLDAAALSVDAGRTDSPGKEGVRGVMKDLFISRANRSLTLVEPSMGSLPSGAYAWNSPQVEMGKIESSRQNLQNEIPGGDEWSWGKSHVEAMDRLITEQYPDVMEIVHVGVAGDAGLVKLDALNYPWLKIIGVEMDEQKVQAARQVMTTYHLQDQVTLMREDAAEVRLPRATGQRIVDATLLFQHMDDEHTAAVLHNLIKQLSAGDVLHIADARLADWGARGNDSQYGEQSADLINNVYQPTMAEAGWKNRKVHFWDSSNMHMPTVLKRLVGEQLQYVEKQEHEDAESWVSTYDSNFSYMMGSIAILLPRVVELNAGWERSQGIWQLAARYATLLGDARVQHRMPTMQHTVWEVVKSINN